MSKIMVFRLGEESYGIDVVKIMEIVEVSRLTPVPKAPKWVEGVLNHHGRIATVLNLYTFFDLPEIKEEVFKKIAVIDDPAMDIGILTEEPIEVISEWEMTSELSGDPEFVKNKYVGKAVISKERLINMLDVDKLINELDSYFT